MAKSEARIWSMSVAGRTRGAQAECSRESSCIGDPCCGQDKCGCDRIHDVKQKDYGRNLTGHMSVGLNSLGNNHVHPCPLGANRRLHRADVMQPVAGRAWFGATISTVSAMICFPIH
jgi:hypothetical protein